MKVTDHAVDVIETAVVATTMKNVDVVIVNGEVKRILTEMVVSTMIMMVVPVPKIAVAVVAAIKIASVGVKIDLIQTKVVATTITGVAATMTTKIALVDHPKKVVALAGAPAVVNVIDRKIKIVVGIAVIVTVVVVVVMILTKREHVIDHDHVNEIVTTEEEGITTEILIVI